MAPFFRDAVVPRLRPRYSPAWAWDPFSGPSPPPPAIRSLLSQRGTLPFPRQPQTPSFRTGLWCSFFFPVWPSLNLLGTCRPGCPPGTGLVPSSAPPPPPRFPSPSPPPRISPAGASDRKGSLTAVSWVILNPLYYCKLQTIWGVGIL